MRELFIEELEEVSGGWHGGGGWPCKFFTTMACCEEAPPCDTCCW